jgi:hypothetical protein
VLPLVGRPRSRSFLKDLSSVICHFSFVIEERCKLGGSPRTDGLEDRLIDFAVRFIRMADAPNDTEARGAERKQISFANGSSPLKSYTKQVTDAE